MQLDGSYLDFDEARKRGDAGTLTKDLLDISSGEVEPQPWYEPGASDESLGDSYSHYILVADTLQDHVLKRLSPQTRVHVEQSICRLVSMGTVIEFEHPEQLTEHTIFVAHPPSSLVKMLDSWARIDQAELRRAFQAALDDGSAEFGDYEVEVAGYLEAWRQFCAEGVRRGMGVVLEAC